MQELGVEQVYIDRMSGKNTDRPELKRMMNYVREGDVVIVEAKGGLIMQWTLAGFVVTLGVLCIMEGISCMVKA